MILPYIGTREGDRQLTQQFSIFSFITMLLTYRGGLHRPQGPYPSFASAKVKPDFRGMGRFLISRQRSNQQFPHHARIEPRPDKKTPLKPRLVLGELLKDLDGTLVRICLQNPVYDFFQRARLAFRC